MDKIFGGLFDFSFHRLITPSLTRYLFMIAVALSGLIALSLILSGFSQGLAPGIMSLIVAPLLFLFMVGLTRVVLEAVLSVFRMANYLAELARAQRKPMPPDPEVDEDDDDVKSSTTLESAPRNVPPPPPVPK
jgi:hypothetical protein